MGPNAPSGTVWRPDLFDITLADGVTAYHWCAWDTDLTVNGVLYSSKAPWLERSAWNVVNTTEVPELTVYLRAFNTAWQGGASIKTQIVGGLFDGASLVMSRAYMTAPPAVVGVLPLFGGKVGAIDIVGTTATLTVKGKVNDLDQNMPRNLFQIGCLHAFCDPNCTLLRANFTFPFVVGASPTASFIPWATPPSGGSGTPVIYQNGSITITSGAAAGQTADVATANSSGVTLAYPLSIAPAPGDTFTAFQGCDKTNNSGSGQSCTDRGNELNRRSYDFVPPPNSAY